MSRRVIINSGYQKTYFNLWVNNVNFEKIIRVRLIIILIIIKLMKRKSVEMFFFIYIININ